jgi:anti-sigma factor ChrR (cupin superfamily)
LRQIFRLAGEIMAATSNSPSRLIEVNQREWQPMAPNARVKPLWSDPATKRRVMLVRMEPGMKSDTHRHIGDELIYVVEGALTDESGTITAGNMSYRPNGCVHTNTSKYGATVLAFLTGEVEPVKDASVNPPRSRPLAVAEMPWTEAFPGMHAKRVWEDPATKRAALIARLEAGAKIKRHRHNGDELIFVLEGTNVDEFCVVTPGNLTYRPDGCLHEVTTKSGGLWLSVATGGIEPA